METIKLNETPVRTARNFKINNIKLENINIPEEVTVFNNVNIIGENSKINIDSNVSKVKLTYGLEETLTNMVNEASNLNMKLVIDSKTNKETQIVCKFDEDNSNLIENIEIVANPNSKATIILKYESTKNLEAFHN